MTVDIRTLSRAYYQNISKTLISERKTARLKGFTPDTNQQKVIENNARFLRMVAPAGSGKTATLTAKAVRLLSEDRNSRVLCLTFTNAAADEFRKKAAKAETSFASRLHVSTINAFGYQLLLDQEPTARIVTANDKFIGRVYGTIKELMSDAEAWGNEANYRLYPSIYDFSDLTKSLGFSHRMDGDVEADYDFVSNLGISDLLDAGLQECGICIDNPKTDFLEHWFPFWQSLTSALWDKKALSLEDQKYWALDRLTESTRSAAWLKSKRLTHIFVDEFQDINILDLYLIQAIVSISKAALVIVGDDDQCIYEWRGCTSAFIRFPDEIFAPILGKKKFDNIGLERNYRCPKNIVVHSSNLIANNRERLSKASIPMRKDDANIKVIPLAAAYMTMNVVDELVAFLAKEHPTHSVAIVGRKKSQLVPIQILLAKRDLNFRVDTDLNIFLGSAFHDLRNVLRLPQIANQRRDSDEIIEDALALLDRAFKSNLSPTDKEGMEEWLEESTPKTLNEAVRLIGDYPSELRRGYVQPTEVSKNLLYFLKSDTVVRSLLSAGIVFKGFQKDFVKSKDEIFYSEPPFSHLADLAVNYEDSFDTFLLDIDNAIERAQTEEPRSAKIELMTALRTKGREFDTVIVLDVNDGIFPNKKSEEAGRIEEERRLFYVTVTRTRNNLLLFDSRRINGKPIAPSRFLDEMKLPKASWLVSRELDTISRRLLSELKI